MLQHSLAEAVHKVRGWGEMRMTFDPRAASAWEAAYYGQLGVEPPGILGAIVARAEPQALRLAITYALLDASPVIELAHLQAALAVWKYASESAAWVFADQLGDPIELKISSRRCSKPGSAG